MILCLDVLCHGFKHDVQYVFNIKQVRCYKNSVANKLDLSLRVRQQLKLALKGF